MTDPMTSDSEPPPGTSEAANLYHIGLDAWIIQDGNYGDFEPGEHAFAVEFTPFEVSPSAGSQRTSLEHVRGAEHEVVGRVAKVFASSAWVIDVGILAYQDQAPPPWATEGQYLSGRVYLGIDPFFYFEKLVRQPEVPALIYRWTVEGIDLETTPWLDSRDARGRELRMRDAQRTSFVSVPRTDAWHDDGGHAHYVLKARP
ncbi:MAG: hypothetical protein JWM53_215, partial [bacterium]|nr:hypothetical protein [bacterium]